MLIDTCCAFLLHLFMADVQDECDHTSFEFSAATFSLDLVEASYQHVRFLKRVHQAGLSLRAPTAEEFRRYEQLWPEVWCDFRI